MAFWKNPIYIALMSVCGLSAASFGLSFVLGFFSYVALVFLVSAFGIGFYLSFSSYNSYRRRVRQKRYTDAYLYAEEQGRPSAIYKFKYPREKENHIRWVTFNKLILVVACVGGAGMGIYLFVQMLINL